MISKSVWSMKELQIEVNAFNFCHRYIIFGIKLVLLGCVIFSGFAAIQFFHDDHLLGICNVLVATEGTFIFVFCYDKGFSVPRSVTKLQRAQMLRLKHSQAITDSQRAYVMRQLCSIRKMAIQVGHFHYLQRVSTPNFIDFCVKNILRLVMSYRRYAMR